MRPLIRPLWHALGALPLAFAFSVAACGDVEHPSEENTAEIITTVTLAFTPSAGGETIAASFADLDGDGGDDPLVEPIALNHDTAYAMAVVFLNARQLPAQDITREIDDESEVHQVFYTGSAVQGPATGANPTAIARHAYGDTDAYGNPVGLRNTLQTLDPGTGTLIVTLRHMPPIHGVLPKDEALAEDVVATDGIAALPGRTDVSVTFDLTVN